MGDVDLVHRLEEFLEQEARSCSMNFGCVTAEYVHRMWGGAVPLEEITAGLSELRKHGYMVKGDC